MKIINQINFKENYEINLRSFLNNKISDIHHEIILFGKKKGNQNFAIFENNNLLGVFPFHIEKNHENTLQATYFNLSLPGPIFNQNLELKKFKKILRLSLDEIEKKCLLNKVKTVKINFSDLINYETGSQKYYTLLEILSDYNYTNKSFIGLRLNLHRNYEEILSFFSKGHKSEIKRQSKLRYLFESSEHNIVRYEDFKIMLKNQVDYDEYFEPLYEMYLQNKIFLVYSSDKKFFFSLFSVAGETVEYFVSKLDSNNDHSLIANSIKYFKLNKKLKYLNLGIINYLENSSLRNSNKKKNISTFKKGFGGEKYLLSIFEKKYF